MVGTADVGDAVGTAVGDSVLHDPHVFPAPKNLGRKTQDCLHPVATFPPVFMMTDRPNHPHRGLLNGQYESNNMYHHATEDVVVSGVGVARVVVVLVA
jgi:hypothetical protein